MIRIASNTLVLLALFSSAIAQNKDLLNGVEQDFEKILAVTKAPGFAVAIVKGDETVYAKGFGYKDVEKKSPMDENTLLAIGSTTKAFTCGILGQLRDEKKIFFTDSPRGYIPELRFYNNELNNELTIQDLMSHRTGIPRHDFSWFLFPTYDQDSLIRRIQFQQPFTGVREQWYYNNFMYLIQGVIAERITGKSWEDNVRERFFEPLGMNRSNLSIEELVKSENIAKGYELYEDSLLRETDYYRIAAMAPAGSINSSVSEMTNWMKVWINNGKFKGEQILPESYVKEAMSSHAVIRSAFPRAEHPDIFLANYGYGWMISSYKGHYEVEHGGNIDGFSASVAIYPTDSLGIVVLTNQDKSAVPSLVRNCIADRMLETKKDDWVAYYQKYLARTQEMDTPKKNNSENEEDQLSSKSSHNLADFVGEYHHPGYGQFNISQKGDSLFANFVRVQFYLKHLHHDIFQPFEVKKTGIDGEKYSVRFNFSTDNEGEIASVKMKLEEALEDPIEFKKMPKKIEIDYSELKRYVGEYELSGQVVKVYTKNDSDLYMFVSGQPEYHLVGVEKGVFILQELTDYKVKFDENEKGDITRLVLLQPNGMFYAKRKE